MSIKNKINLDFATDLDFSQILTNPILDIAARLWEDDRYKAFQVCYRSMRVIDDLVDNKKINNLKLSKNEQNEIYKLIDSWKISLITKNPTDAFQSELLTIIEKYKINFTPWIRLSQAMYYDLNHNGFSSILSFLRYTEGAAIAPASIFMHLLGVRKTDSGFLPPEYDIRLAARPLAIFSYLVHIIRDFQKDQKAGLNYFADNLLMQNNLNQYDLRNIAESNEVTPSFRNLMATYSKVADYYRLKSLSNIELISQHLEPRYNMSLKLIYQLYLQIFEKIDIENGNFTTEELNPSAKEIQNRIDYTISRFK